jgi:hypothetical protein
MWIRNKYVIKEPNKSNVEIFYTISFNLFSENISNVKLFGKTKLSEFSFDPIGKVYTSISNKTLNNTFFLKIRVFTNGSYVEFWSSGVVNDYSNRTNWFKYYFIQKPLYARQIVTSDTNADGSTFLTFLNKTSRYVYPPLTRRNTTF